MFYKRKSFILNLIALIISACLFCGCNSDLPPRQQIIVHADFSVNYLNVGQGDAIFIRLPDGKNVLIDCGINQESVLEVITDYLSAYSVDKIDYFVLTHPDLDHIGNACSLINAYVVGELYLPYIHQSQLSSFVEFSKVLDLANQKGIETKVFDCYTYIKGLDYAFAFLSPMAKGTEGSSYDDMFIDDIVSDSKVNNLSPIIYFECFTKRFVFTGDAEQSQEELVVDNYNNGFYEWFYSNKNINVNLENIDFLKLSHHGAKDGSCEKFLSLLKSKNAIISVGGQNFYGHPASETLQRLLSICPDHQIYRTDVNGTICVYIDAQNKIKIDSATKKA